MPKIIRVHMTDLSIKDEDIPEAYLGLGGRGLTSAIVSTEVDAASNPIGSHNKLVFAPGLLGGTNCANSGRISVGGKSPLTGGIKEANSGGQAGEWKLSGASVAFTDRELRPTRHAGRGGLGAVMGSKGLKAIIIDPSGGESAPIIRPVMLYVKTSCRLEAMWIH